MSKVAASAPRAETSAERDADAVSDGVAGGARQAASADDILDQLETGQINYKDAVRLLRSARKKERRDG